MAVWQFRRQRAKEGGHQCWASQLQESELAGALQKKPEFVLPQHEELFHFAISISISILQNAKLPLCLASLTKLPPNITQLTH